ncbi:MAG: energy transducer TonB [Cycloclasticus sp. symbiont of Poecilosclerida sp. N]|nr:MAG: energy transducer TonB [Cycloclasticus sp. symbiont of Poecilosclerida sp. N]
MSNTAHSLNSLVYKPKSIIFCVALSIVSHLFLAAFVYKTGVFSTDDIASIPAKTISVSLVEPSPIRQVIPVQPPKPKEIKKKRIITQAPSPKTVYKKPEVVKKTDKPKPPVVKKKAVSSPLPSPVNKPTLFTSPQPSYQPKPMYPNSARRRGAEGVVVFEISIANNGHVNNAIIIQSSGYSVLDRSAMKAIKTWRFPASKFNTFSTFKQKVEFRLNGY